MENTDNNITEEIHLIRYYLIDYENVHQTGMNGIEKLTEKDRLVIFYTANAETLTFSLYEKLVQCKAEIQLYKVQCGAKNALDFQLATFLGYILGDNPDTDCHIISSDKGYEYVRSFWKEKNIKIKISSDIEGNVKQTENSPAPVAKTVTPSPVSKSAETDFDKAVKPLNLSKSDKQKLSDIYNKALLLKDNVKIRQQINNQIGKIFGSENQKKYYSAIKPLIK
ncbi:MAG: PIN domain-containing protein [Ruminococcus flavefaciens]|nr:PIN domain-containing protein [Ruminococcus flavefaciens]